MKKIITIMLLSVPLLAIDIYTSVNTYYLTNDNESIFAKESSVSGVALNLGVSKKLFDYTKMNLLFIGFTDLGKSIGGSIEPFNLNQNNPLKSFLAIGNIHFDNNKFKSTLGRQTLNTPMISSIGKYLFPSHFEAYSFEAYSLIKNIKLYAVYISKLRGLTTGIDFNTLDGDNYGLGIEYEDTLLLTKSWYYSIDSKQYSQIYFDIKNKSKIINISAQYINTQYKNNNDSLAYGLKISSNLLPLNLTLAYNNVKDNEAGKIQADSLYTSSWNTFTSTKIGEAFKISGSKQITGLTITSGYAKYDDAKEFDFIISKNFTNFSLKTIYTNTKYNKEDLSVNQFEIAVNYSF